MATDATGQGEGQAAAARRDDTRPDAAWKNIQKSAFCRWANEHLKSADLEITELETDLGDGIRLIRLAEALAGEKITQRYNARPTNRTQKLENITMCLQFLERQQKVRIVNIGKHARTSRDISNLSPEPPNGACVLKKGRLHRPFPFLAKRSFLQKVKYGRFCIFLERQNPRCSAYGSLRSVDYLTQAYYTSVTNFKIAAALDIMKCL